MIKQFLYYLLLTMTFSIGLSAAPARGGLHTYTQPDGSTFKAYLKGDASFHWMENDSGIILFNPKDGYFYKAEIDTKSGQLYRTPQRITQTPEGVARLQSAPQRSVLSIDERQRLLQLYKESKIGPHPR
jgi:hypothetical protein